MELLWSGAKQNGSGMKRVLPAQVEKDLPCAVGWVLGPELAGLFCRWADSGGLWVGSDEGRKAASQGATKQELHLHMQNDMHIL